MTSQSDRIERTINLSHTVDLRVVFVDIEKYTARKKAQTQRKIVEKLMECLRGALKKTSEKYNSDNQNGKDIDFQKDIIKIMTGDGAAIVSPFAHSGVLFFFAKRLLEEIYNSNKQTGCGVDKCDQYNEEGRYCAIHPIFGIRIGIAKDLGIIYKDINDLPNVAGKAINDASRVMNIADRDQILLNKEACKEVVDNDPTLTLERDFIHFRDVRIKRDIKRDVYQYIGKQDPDKESYINDQPPQKVKDSMSLTRSDLEDALKPIKVELIQQLGILRASLGYQILRNTEAIYLAVAEAISKAERYIRIVRLASRPKVTDKVLEVIAQKVLKEDVNYEIVVAWDPKDSTGEFRKNHEKLLEQLGDNRGYDPRVLKTNGSICFDILIVDRRAVGIGYTPSKRGSDLEQAILFEKEDVADGFVRWFDVVKKKAISYAEWERRYHAT